MSQSDDYRRLQRLREKRARLDRHISMLTAKLSRKRICKKARWGNCSYWKNRK